jgi:hypothetical protein
MVSQVKKTKKNEQNKKTTNIQQFFIFVKKSFSHHFKQDDGTDLPENA